jgi:hypothetical protein
MDLWWTKWRWGGFSPSTSVSPANLHSTKLSIIIITQGISGRRAEWTQLDFTPPLSEFKKKLYLLIPFGIFLIPYDTCGKVTTTNYLLDKPRPLISN